MATTFRAMTYNVHSCVGTDGKLEPARIADVIASLNPDIVALQEVDVGQSRSLGVHQPEWLAARLGMRAHFTAARTCEDGHYGNAVLTRHPFTLVSEGRLARRRDEQRAVQWLSVRIAGQEVNVLNTHLSIHLRDRLLQVEQLLGAEWLAKARGAPLVICGDLNSGQFSPVYRKVQRGLRDVQRVNGHIPRPTWPSRMPFLRLDHVFASTELRVWSSEVRRDALAAIASDHLPLVTDLTCAEGPS